MVPATPIGWKLRKLYVQAVDPLLVADFDGNTSPIANGLDLFPRSRPGIDQAPRLRHPSSRTKPDRRSQKPHLRSVRRRPGRPDRG